MSQQILKGYTSIERPYTVEDYPYGFRLRTSIHYWVESKAGKGDRFCSYTINPKNGRRNNPKCGIYHPFIYLFINEEGHVEHGLIESYEREEFKARFEFILTHIGEEFINDIQKQNLRVNHYHHVAGNAPYEVVKYNEENKPKFKEWVKATLAHIKTCEFKELVSYPEKPAFDMPDETVKF